MMPMEEKLGMHLLASVVDANCSMLNVAGLLDGKNIILISMSFRRVMRGILIMKFSRLVE